MQVGLTGGAYSNYETGSKSYLQDDLPSKVHSGNTRSASPPKPLWRVAPYGVAGLIVNDNIGTN